MPGAGRPLPSSPAPHSWGQAPGRPLDEGPAYGFCPWGLGTPSGPTWWQTAPPGCSWSHGACRVPVPPTPGPPMCLPNPQLLQALLSWTPPDLTPCPSLELFQTAGGGPWPHAQGSGLPGRQGPTPPLPSPAPQDVLGPRPALRGPRPSTTSWLGRAPGSPGAGRGSTDQGSTFCTPRVDPSTLTLRAPGGQDAAPRPDLRAGGRTHGG